MRAAQIRKAAFRLWMVVASLIGAFFLWGGLFVNPDEAGKILTIGITAIAVLGVAIGGLGWVVSAFFDE